MKKIVSVLLIISLMLPATACGRGGETEKNMTGQKNIDRIGRYESVLPREYAWFDYEERAALFDTMVFDETLSGTYLPLIWQDETYDTFGITAYVGDGRWGNDGAEEAVMTVASVLSATLMGIDKSSQNGTDYVSMLHAYYSEEEKIILNNPAGSSKTTSMWYLIYPAILYTQVAVCYPEETQLAEDALHTIESWYEAARIMAEEGSFDYTGFDFTVMQPYQNDIWREPDSAAGIAVLMWYGYQMTGEQKYFDMTVECLDFIAGYEGSSLYEALLYFAPSLSAKMNAEYGAKYDVGKLLNDVLNGGSIPRGGWGSIVGTWGDYEMNGLMGSTTDGGGYAFAMNSFAAAYAMSSLAKYDTRYAKDLGIWYLHAASNGRYFFSDTTAMDNQSAVRDSEAQALLEKYGYCIPYEGIRKSAESKTPYIGGDPTVYGWAETDLSLYSGAHTGMMGAVVHKTDVDGILKINCNAQVTERDAYQAWLLFNPYETEQKIIYELPEGSFDLFDSVTKKVIKTAVSGNTEIVLAPGQAMVIIELPAGSTVQHEAGQYTVNDKWIASDTVTVSLNGLENNSRVSGKVKLPVVCLATDEQAEIESVTVTIDGTELIFNDTQQVVFRTEDFSEGSKTVLVTVKMQDGTEDTTSIRLNFE
ncbi:MAG: hypothetical protein UFG06_01890 [Lachnospiraceae bacterium]|nr:hypothetical protein [Lachnospiraceae bacterium]